MKKTFILCFLFAVLAFGEEEEGILYDYTINYQNQMEWDIAPEALEVGTARGVAAGLISPLSELGDMSAVGDAHSESITDFSDDFVGSEIIQGGNDSDRIQDVVGTSFSSAITNFSQPVRMDGSFMFDSGFAGSPVAYQNLKHERKLTFPVNLISFAAGDDEAFPVLSSEPLVISFDEGWKKTVYELFGTCSIVIYSFIAFKAVMMAVRGVL